MCSASGSWGAFLNVYSLRTALISQHGLDFDIPANTQILDVVEPIPVNALVPVNDSSVQIDSDSENDAQLVQLGGSASHSQPHPSFASVSQSQLDSPSQQWQQLQTQAIVPLSSAGDGSDPRTRVMNLVQMDHTELAKMCVKKDDMLKKKDQRIAKLRNELKKLQRRGYKNEQLAVKAMQQLAVQKLEAFSISKLGKAKEGRGGRLSLVSMFGIGIRRCLTNVAALDFGVLSMADVSGQTVIRAEHRTASAIIFSMHSFFSEASELAFQQHRLFQSASDDCKKNHWSLTCVGFRTDATNSSVWRRKKIQVLECTGAFLANDSPKSTMRYKRCVCLVLI